MAISAANFALTPSNASTVLPTPYTITAGDVSAGITIPPSFFTALNYNQAGFVPERLALFFNTTTAGTAFSAVIKATKPTTDVPNVPPPFPLANAGDLTVNINAINTYVIGGLTSGRFSQPDGSILINFTGTLGVTTMYGLLDPYAPAGPRG